LLDKPAPKISVCLPTYNRAQYLRETIVSMLAQTATDFELIVADNCSTDSTTEVVAAFQDPRIRYVRNQENIGHYRNMDRVLALARGAYVCIIHDDDVYAPEFLARESEMLDRHQTVGMVHCAVYVVSPDRQRLRVHRVSRHTRIAPGMSEFIQYLGGHDVCCSTVMCRRDVWVRAGRFEHRLMCAYWLMWLTIALQTDIAYIATPLVDMRVHDSSMTSTMDPMRWYDEFVAVSEKALDKMRGLGVEPGQSIESLRRQSSARQSRRFLIAALAAAAAGEDQQVQGYLSVLTRLQERGAPSIYSRTGRLLALKSARPIMRAVRTVRREFTRARVRCAAF
jgi:glycosyltransferase involved in cell wall biosynthesis